MNCNTTHYRANSSSVPGDPTDHFAPRAAARAAGPFRILCVASFEEVKGHRWLVEACALLRDRGVAFACDLVGDGPRRAEVESRIAAFGLGAQVRVHGPQARDRVRELLGAADVAALASVPTREGKREGIPVVLMEAMAAGLPVVASRLSGIPELVEDGVSGRLVEPRDAAGLADALEALARDPETAARMGRAGRAVVLQRFDQERNAASLLDCIRAGIGVPPCSK